MSEKAQEVSTQQIEDWKKEHGEVYLIEVAEEPIDFDSEMVSLKIEEGQPTAKAYLKKPDTKIQSFAYARMQESPVAAGETILKTCWLAGDERLKEHPSFRTAAALKAMALVEPRIGRLKKL